MKTKVKYNFSASQGNMFFMKKKKRKKKTV